MVSIWTNHDCSALRSSAEQWEQQWEFHYVNGPMSNEAVFHFAIGWWGDESVFALSDLDSEPPHPHLLLGNLGPTNCLFSDSRVRIPPSLTRGAPLVEGRWHSCRYGHAPERCAYLLPFDGAPLMTFPVKREHFPLLQLLLGGQAPSCWNPPIDNFDCSRRYINIDELNWTFLPGVLALSSEANDGSCFCTQRRAQLPKKFLCNQFSQHDGLSADNTLGHCVDLMTRTGFFFLIDRLFPSPLKIFHAGYFLLKGHTHNISQHCNHV